MRETAGGVFDTPERRAELEKTLRELTSRIRDESVRFHYQQDMRDRVQAFFGPVRAPQGRHGKQGDRDNSRGGNARPGQVSGRLAISESLTRSAMVKRAGGLMPMRETVLLVALVNHPQLIDEYFDHVEALEFSHAELRQLHTAIIDAVAHGDAGDRNSLRASLQASGMAEIWDRAVLLVRRARQWPALEEAALEDAREAFAQALHLQRSARNLHKELKLAETALAADPTDENYRHLIEIQAQFRDLQATEALIEGFGIPSGRVDRT
jgi:DNA primase